MSVDRLHSFRSSYCLARPQDSPILPDTILLVLPRPWKSRMRGMSKRTGLLTLSKGAGMSSFASEVQVTNPGSRVGLTMPVLRLGVPPEPPTP